MTDKERLEGIREDAGANAKKEHEIITEILFEDALWLIEQSKLKNMLHDDLLETVVENTILQEQNKRYREAIVIALGELTTILEIENLTQGQIRECAGNAYNKLHEALEELS